MAAIPDGQRVEAKAIDEMQGTPSTKHRRTKIRTHETDEEDQGEDEEESEEIKMEIYDEEDPGETVEDIAMKQNVLFSRIGQSYIFTIKARGVLKCGPHFCCPGCKYITGEVATQPGHQD